MKNFLIFAVCLAFLVACGSSAPKKKCANVSKQAHTSGYVNGYVRGYLDSQNDSKVKRSVSLTEVYKRALQKVEKRK